MSSLSAVVLIAVLVARGDRAEDEECLLQVARGGERSSAVAVAPRGGMECEQGDRVRCPSEVSEMCSGNECCRRTPSSGNLTFPCPSATADFAGCENNTRIATCAARFPSDCSDGSSLVAAGLEVVTPRARDYDKKRTQWASKMGSVAASSDGLSPQLMAFCSSEGHVVRAVNFAKKCGYRVSVRSGGHQYSGFSSCIRGLRCMQLDVSALDIFEYDAQGDLLTLGVGLRIHEVYSRLVSFGLALPLGLCNDVGLGGHLQSSSIGYMSRTEGLGMDHIDAFRIVLANGSIRRIDRNSTIGCEGGNPCERNLFWAALGGSPGSWGVILDYTFRPVHASSYPHTSVGRGWLWPYRHDLFVALSKVVMEIHADPRFERDFASLVLVEPTPELSGVPALNAIHGGNPLFHYINLVFAWFGRDTGEFTADVEAQVLGKVFQAARPIMRAMKLPFDSIPIGLVRPGYGQMVRMPLPQMMVRLATNWTQVEGYRYHVHGFSSNHWYTTNFIEVVANELDARIREHPDMYSSFQWTPLGGAQANGGKGSQVNRNGDGRNAYPLRDVAMYVDDWVWFGKDDQAQIAKDIIRTFHESNRRFWEAPDSAEQTFMTTSTFHNYSEIEEKFLQYSPSMDWFDRLVAVKSLVDPTDLFRAELTIPPRQARNGQ